MLDTAQAGRFSVSEIHNRQLYNKAVLLRGHLASRAASIEAAAGRWRFSREKTGSRVWWRWGQPPAVRETATLVVHGVTCARLVKRARCGWLPLAEGHLTRRLRNFVQ